MYLIDTMVISEFRKRNCDPKVEKWRLAIKRAALFISVVSLFEIRKGICAQEKTNPLFARELSVWIMVLQEDYRKRILPVTAKVAEEWGRISYTVGNSNADNIIAATAKVHNLTVATRNIRHFQAVGVSYVNPWE